MRIRSRLHHSFLALVVIAGVAAASAPTAGAAASPKIVGGCFQRVYKAGVKWNVLTTQRANVKFHLVFVNGRETAWQFGDLWGAVGPNWRYENFYGWPYTGGNAYFRAYIWNQNGSDGASWGPHSLGSNADPPCG